MSFILYELLFKKTFLQNVGLQYARTQLQEWVSEGKLFEIIKGKSYSQEERYMDSSVSSSHILVEL